MIKIKTITQATLTRGYVITKSTLYFSIILLFVLYGCRKSKSDSDSDDSETAEVVSISNPNALQQSLKINNATLQSGNLPTSSTSQSTPRITSNQSSVDANPGTNMVLPLQYSTNNGISKIYLQVVGASNGYIEIIVSNSASNSIGVSIQMPAGLTTGSFQINYSLVDNNNQISAYKNTIIKVSAPLDCNNAKKSGSSGLTYTNINLGSTGGEVTVKYDTYSLPDRIDIYQGTTWLTGTGTNPNSLTPPLATCNQSPMPSGFVGNASSLSFTYNPSNGKIITIVVSGCTTSSTAWDWSLIFPNCTSSVNTQTAGSTNTTGKGTFTFNGSTYTGTCTFLDIATTSYKNAVLITDNTNGVNLIIYNISTNSSGSTSFGNYETIVSNGTYTSNLWAYFYNNNDYCVSKSGTFTKTSARSFTFSCTLFDISGLSNASSYTLSGNGAY